jgi:preprotein translocase subunit SecG
MDVLEHYDWLKYVASKINVAMSTMTGAFIAGNLPFFATTVLEVFGVGTRNIFARLRYIIACFFFFPSICVAANANKKVEDMKVWICKEENYRKIPITRLTVFLHDLTFHSVGLNALGILTINWNSVGSVIYLLFQAGSS